MGKGYYTVLRVQGRYSIKYASVPDYTIQTLAKDCETIALVTEEFKSTVKGAYEHLDEEAFLKKVSTLAARYQQELVRLRSWNAGRPANG
jgi:hypothetical protein